MLCVHDAVCRNQLTRRCAIEPERIEHGRGSFLPTMGWHGIPIMDFRETRLEDAFWLNRRESRTNGDLPAPGPAKSLRFMGFAQSLSKLITCSTGQPPGVAPYEEAKLVHCIRGSIFDIAVDLRSDSPTYRQWVGVELTAKQGNMLYVPAGFAHGYQELEDHTEVSYLVSSLTNQRPTAAFFGMTRRLGLHGPLGNPGLFGRRIAIGRFRRPMFNWTTQYAPIEPQPVSYQADDASRGG